MSPPQESKEEMTKSAEFRDLIVCDDVRMEYDGRYSLMGVYAGRMLPAPRLPVVFSQMAFVLRFSNVTEETTLLVTLIMPDGLESQPVQGRRLAPDSPETDCLFVIFASPLQISRAGIYGLKLQLGDEELETSFEVFQPA